MQEADTPPAWLETPPESDVPPPIETKLSELPFNALSWTDFERLCLRLARESSDIEICRHYGVPGDAQEGIDLFARIRATSTYRVYQCKRVKGFGPSEIAAAVDKFYDGDWRPRTSTFYLCTMESLSGKLRTDELLKQRTRLGTEGIDLVPWDADALSEELRSHPQIVDDFFGRQWVQRFCGNDAAARLGSRLDKQSVAKLRRGLAKLYFNIFRSHDPTLAFRNPLLADGPSTTLPDIIDDTTPRPADDFTRRSPPPQTQVESSYIDPRTGTAKEAPRQDVGGNVQQRISTPLWIANSGSCLILGGPGSGKSTLLRVLTLDLLSTQPVFKETARRWGTFLPIWVPFARWTALLAEAAAGKTSLLELLRGWFELHDAKELIPLVEHALDDERLLLVVDGLDEWQHPDAGRSAFTLLCTFVERRNIPLIACARPHALHLFVTPSLKHGELGTLTAPQQHAIVADALRREMKSSTEGADGTLVEGRTQACLRELSIRNDLVTLARTPMLLNLLVHLWHRDVDLPANRFEAYSRIIDVLIATHPAQRRAAAHVQRDTMRPDILRDVMARLALHLIERHSTGIILRRVAAKEIEAHLADQESGLALSLNDAKSETSQLLEYVTDSVGLLVAHSPTEVGFLHRVLMERLAAEAVAAKTGEDRRAFVQHHASNPQMHETILALTSLLRSAEDGQAVIDAVRAGLDGAFQRLMGLPLLAEIALAARSCPPRTAQAIAAEMLEEIERGPYLGIKKRLLQLAVRGLRAGPTQSLIRKQIYRWLPRRLSYRSGVYLAAADWPTNNAVLEFLRRGLYEEDTGEVRAAASSALVHAKRAGGIGALIDLATRSPIPRIRAGLLDALLRSGELPSEEACERIIGNSPHAELRLVGVHARILHKSVRDGDLVYLLKAMEWSRLLPWGWRHDVPDILLQGWPRSERVRDECLQALKGQNRMDSDLARRLLVRGYCRDPLVTEILVQELQAERPPFDREVWPLYDRHARDIPAIAEAMDALLAKLPYDPVGAHWAALTSGSEHAKRSLIERLEMNWPGWPARALLVRWGMGDSEVAERLTAFLTQPDRRRAAAMAHLAPQILGNREECRAYLWSLLEVEASTRFHNRLDFVLRGLATIRDEGSEPEAVSRYLAAEAESGNRQARHELIANWCDDHRVESLALTELDNPDCEGNALALGARRSEALRESLMDKSGVLSASLRLTLAHDLGAYVVNRESREQLSLYTHEHDGAVRAMAAISYCQSLGTEAPGIMDTLTHRFQRELMNVGTSMDEAREAALCGLLELGKVELFASAREERTGDPAELVSIHSFSSAVSNTTLWRQITKCWGLLRQHLDKQLFPRLFGGDADSIETWETLAAFAEPRTPLGLELRERILRSSPERVGPNMLRFLYRDSGPSARLRDLCLDCIRNRSDLDFAIRTGERAVVGATVLAAAFGGDDEVLKLASLTCEESAHDNMMILALCEGWPQSEILNQILAHIRAKHLLISGVIRLALIATLGTVVEFQKLMAQDYVEGLRPCDLDPSMRLIMRRLHQDPEVAEATVSLLEDADSATWARVVRVLGRVRSLPAGLRQEAERRIAHELAGSVAPLLLLDPVDGSIRTSGSILFEIV